MWAFAWPGCARHRPGSKEDHGPRRQALFAPKLLAGFQFEVNFIGTFLGLLAVPPNAVKIVLFLLLLLRDFGSKTVIGIGANSPRCADSADAFGRR